MTLSNFGRACEKSNMMPCVWLSPKRYAMILGRISPLSCIHSQAGGGDECAVRVASTTAARMTIAWVATTIAKWAQQKFYRMRSVCYHTKAFVLFYTNGMTWVDG